MRVAVILWALAALPLAGPVHGGSILEAYGAGPFDPEAGAAAWVRAHRRAGDARPRSCSGCHGADLTRPGRHVKTGKPIEPLAVSVNPGRLTDIKKVEKWLRRNCRWTLGRECTAREKGDFLGFISSQ